MYRSVNVSDIFGIITVVYDLHCVNSALTGGVVLKWDPQNIFLLISV